MRNKIIAATALVAIGLLTIAGAALGQDNGTVTEPTIGLLASAAGLSTVVFIIMNLLRGSIGAGEFDRWAPLISVAVAILLAEIYVVAAGDVTSEAVIQAALIGLFAGGFSQNVNTIAKRATGNTG